MPDPALSQAIKEAYAAAPSDVVILHTLELRHPAFDDDAGNPTANFTDDQTLAAELDQLARNLAGRISIVSRAEQFQQPTISIT